MNRQYKKLNILIGWIVFAIATFTYLSTLEPTASFWDCGEFIAAAWKLEVGHPPGAPFFLLVGRLFTLFAGGNTEHVALMVNALSGLASSFTILFLFWTITHLVKRMLVKEGEEATTAEKIAILGSGIVGALAYTFSDTFWFSAVEGEVYASSSLFTAVVFWAILKWENVADSRYANRWLILIAYLMGLSIGVHLLNLLAIPAIVLIYYFKKYPFSKKGLAAAIAVSAVILGGIMYIVIPGAVQFAILFEKIFVNGFGLPYFSGMYFYFLLVALLLVIGLLRTHKAGKVIANTAILCVTVILIGYSSYAVIVIRSNANPPMDQNNPENLFNLLSYLNREQYGDNPLLYGEYFNAPAVSVSDGKKVYVPIDGKYEVIHRKPKYEYHNDYKTFFPRMYSQSDPHIQAYIRWTNLTESELFEPRRTRDNRIVTDPRTGKTVYDYNKPVKKPGFIDNLTFFFRYQVNHMYFRYFMWNFSGRQNDIQSHFREEITKGNWMTGFKALDEARLGNQEEIADAQLNNPARNKYYLLPLVLGIIGMIFQYRADKFNFWVVATLFVLTGLAIVIYLNQYPIQPRERDYAYAGSFYAFAIWIGIAVSGLYRAARNITRDSAGKLALRAGIVLVVLGILDFAANDKFTITLTALLTMVIILLFIGILRLIGTLTTKRIVHALAALLITLPVPVLMAMENWDDHDRSHRYVARDFAANYLNSCRENAIIFTNGDNDTFPLWYAQEVEDIRTDIRVINLSYLSADWYIEQMAYKAYESEPVKMTLTRDEYRQGRRDMVALVDRVEGHVNLKEAIEFLSTERSKLKPQPGYRESVYHLPQHRFSLRADSARVFSNGTIKPGMENKFRKEIRWELRQNYLTKNHLMAYDFLATNEWERPICYAVTVSNENYIGLDNFFEMNGMAYQIIPAVTTDGFAYSGGINTGEMYTNMMEKFRWGGIEEHDVYLDENCVRMFSNMRHNFGALAQALIAEGKVDSALQALDRGAELISNDLIPFDVFTLSYAEAYYQAGNREKGREIAEIIADNTADELDYIVSLSSPYSGYLSQERQIAMYAVNQLIEITEKADDRELNARIQNRFEKYGAALAPIFR